MLMLSEPSVSFQLPSPSARKHVNGLFKAEQQRQHWHPQIQQQSQSNPLLAAAAAASSPLFALRTNAGSNAASSFKLSDALLLSSRWMRRSVVDVRPSYYRVPNLTTLRATPTTTTSPQDSNSEKKASTSLILRVRRVLLAPLVSE